MRRLVFSFLMVGCLCLMASPAQAQRNELLPPCGPFDVLETGIFPGSGYDADPLCDASEAPPPGCDGEDLVLSDQSQLESFWAQHDPGGTPPTIDFHEQVVVVTLLGERRNTGYSTRVSCVRYFETNLFRQSVTRGVLVEIEDFSPGPYCIVQPAFSNPYQIVAVNRPQSLLPSGPAVQFSHEAITIQCPGDDECPGGSDCPCRICLPEGPGSVVFGPISNIPCCP